MDDLSQVYFKFAMWLWRIFLKKLLMYFHYVTIISLWKWNLAGPSFEQIEIPFPLECFVRSLVEFG